MGIESLKLQRPAAGALRSSTPAGLQNKTDAAHSTTLGVLTIVAGAAATGAGILTVASGGAAFPLIVAAMAISGGPAAIVSGGLYLSNQLSEEQFSGVTDTLSIVSSPVALVTYTGSHLAGASDSRALLLGKVASAGTGAWLAAQKLNDVLRLREAATFEIGYELGSASGDVVAVSVEALQQHQSGERKAVEVRKASTSTRESEMSRGQQRAEAAQRTRESNAGRERPSEGRGKQGEVSARGETRPGAGDRSQWDGPRNGGKGGTGNSGKSSSGGGVRMPGLA